MSEANYVIDDNGQWHDVTLTRRIEELEALRDHDHCLLTKLEAENAELRRSNDVLCSSDVRLDHVEYQLKQAKELLRRWRVAGIDHDLHDDTDAFLKENP